MSAVLTRAAAPSPSPLLLLGMVLLLPLLVYFGTVRSIVTIWNNSDTFAHGYLILPISLWLIWQRRAALASIPVQPWLPALGLIALCGFGWLLAELGQVQVVRQYAVVGMLPLAVLAVMGKQFARALAFPLGFLMFGVPFGEVFIDPLIGVTANFTVDALRLTGIPVYREGNNFTIPSGSWSVVEACSGVRYLIASATIGCLYAYLTYRSLSRRALFMVAAILVPILANGLRAYMIVMIGHHSGMTLAVGVDHLIYGWVFFGIVMFLLFWVGSFWRQDMDPAAVVDTGAQKGTHASVKSIAGAALAALLCIALWPAYLAMVERSSASAKAPVLQSLPSNWPQGAAFSDWTPAFGAPGARLHQFFDYRGRPVGLTLLYYRNQSNGSKLITSTNRLIDTEQTGWRQVGATLRTETVSGRELNVRETRLVGPSGPMLVWSWYAIGGTSTSSDITGKALQIRQKLIHGSDDGAAVMLFAPYDESLDPARTALRSFLNEHLGALDATLAAAQ